MFLVFFGIGYGFTNRFPVFTPKLLPLTNVDHFFGFQPWTIWIYVSDYLLVFLPIILISEVVFMKQLIKAYLVNLAIHFPVFFFFPTTMLRPELNGGAMSEIIFRWVRFIDAPVNCFPSQHVSLCFIVALGFWNYQRKMSLIFILWAVFISISTMTTKQHYFIDVIGGIFVALIVYVSIFYKKAPRITLVDPKS